MVGVWFIAVVVLLPIPLISLVLLSIPFPKSISSSVRPFILSMLEFSLFRPIFKKRSIHDLCIAMSFILFLMTSAESYYFESKRDEKHLLGEKLLCQKWRNERNFWISFLSFVLWLVQRRVYKMSKELEQLKSK